ncbi:MAG: class I adenylate-forming enzyme family protein, partial [Acidimicrobiales bacterium]
LIEDERVTVAQGVPTQWRLMLSLPQMDGADLRSLRLVGTGASNVPPELVREMRSRLGVPVVVGYTSTEAAITTRSRIGDADEDVARTVGGPSDGVEVKVTDEEGAALGPGEVGGVRCRSAATMRGYWRDPELTARVLSPEGWLSTGDLGYLDERGYLTLVGRQTEMYIRGGYNVYPAEVEAVLSEHPLVGQAAVVGVGNKVLGEVGVAFVTGASAPSAAIPPPAQVDAAVAMAPKQVDAAAVHPQADQLREWCRDRLADYKAPDEIYLVGALPLTTMSKVDKTALRARAEELRRNGT